MKKLIILILSFTLFACNSNNSSERDASMHPEVKREMEISKAAKKIDKTQSIKATDAVPFSGDLSSLENSNAQNPIEEFQHNSGATEVIDLTKNNIKDVLNKAKNYQSLIITTDNHTIVKITDLSNCKQSGSWGVCMPYGTGYIKKGKLQPQKDYINNIIGLPDSRVRKAYLFK